MQKRLLFVSGSPRSGGNSETVLALAERAAQNQDILVERFFISEGEVAPCIACNYCAGTGECFMSDREDEFFAKADAADALLIATPVFFAGVPAQLKAVYDRFQPRWAARYLLGEPAREKRPAYLAVLGTGSDPFGYEPVVTTSKSALAMIGFRVDKVVDFIGFDHKEETPEQVRLREKALAMGRELATRVLEA